MTNEYHNLWEEGENPYTKRFGTGNSETLTVGSVERIRQDIKRKWENALKIEGFGRVNAYNTTGRINDITKNVNVTEEIESLLDYVKLMSFYNETEYDRNNRKIFFVEAAKNYFKAKTLNKSIIPATSFVKTIIDNRAILYDKEATRRIFNSTSDDEVLQELIDESSWNIKSQSFYSKLKLTNFVAVRPVVRNVNKKQKLQFDIYTPDKFRVLMNNQNDIVKVLYEGTRYEQQGLEDVIYVWTDKEHYYINCEGDICAIEGNEQMVNPYGFIPFVFMQLNDEDGYYSGGNYDLVESVIEYNIYKLLTMDDAIYSSFNLLWGHDVDFGNDPEISPRDIVVTKTGDGEKETPQLSFINATPHFPEMNTQAIEVYKQAAKLNGVPAFLISDSIQEFNSSKAMRTGMFVMLNERMKDAVIMEQYENELVVMVARVINHAAKSYGYKFTLNEELVFKGFDIDYVDPTFESDDPIKDLELKEKYIEANVMNYAQLYKEINSDADSIEDAIEKIQDNIKINAQFKQAGVSFADLFVEAKKEKLNPEEINTKKTDNIDNTDNKDDSIL